MAVRILVVSPGLTDEDSYNLERDENDRRRAGISTGVRRGREERRSRHLGNGTSDGDREL
jgi:hypothetical protein